MIVEWRVDGDDAGMANVKNGKGIEWSVRLQFNIPNSSEHRFHSQGVAST